MSAGGAQDSPDSNHGKFVQPAQLVWLAMNVLMTLMRPDAMAALLRHEWPGLVSVLLQGCGAAGQHVWMVMGCVRTLLQCLGSQVGSQQCLIVLSPVIFHSNNCWLRNDGLPTYSQMSLQPGLV